jgi:citrate synthase
MAEQDNTKNIGLRGVKVADTRISDVDGTNGILIYRGYPIEELAEHSTYEETAYLLRIPKNARRLLVSIAELEAGRGTERELLE